VLWLPRSGEAKIISNEITTGHVTPGTNVQSNTSEANGYGTVVELISAANNIADSWAIEIFVCGTGAAATATSTCLDILVGGATDDILIDSLLVGYIYSASAHRALPRYFFFPVHVPAGLRVAARIASVVNTNNAYVIVRLHCGSAPPFRVGRKVTTYGTKAGNARGVDVNPTASNGAATVTEISASSTADHFYFLPGFQPEGTTAMTPAGTMCVGIGVGASTEERIGTWFYHKTVNEHMDHGFPRLGAFREVASGTRLTYLASGPTEAGGPYGGLIYAV